MNTRLESMKQRIRAGEPRAAQHGSAIDVLAEWEAEQLSWPRRASRLIRRQCESEEVVIDPNERIAFTRTVSCVPPIYGPEAWAKLTEGRTLHELGPISNICADWSLLLSQGLLGRKEVALQSRQRLHSDPAAVEFLESAIETIDAVLALAARYAIPWAADGIGAPAQAITAGLGRLSAHV